MDDFEKAIRVVFSQDPSITPALREQANGFCEAVKQRPDCWQFCWEQFSRRECLEVKFWCLQVLPACTPSLPPQARAELRAQLLIWLRDVLPNKSEEVAIRNKVALVYVVLLKFDYPANWPSAWKDLVGLLEKGPALVDMYLRILATFDQEVVSDEVPRSPEDRQLSQTIKHAMREGDVLCLAESWFLILGNFRQADPQIIVNCLKAVSVYIVWVEILTVANDKFLSLICGIVAEGGAPAAEASQCLAAVIGKKMPAGKKVQMLEQLQILRRLEGCIHRNSTDLSLLEREAELFNGVGEVALEAYVDLRVQTDEESKRCAASAWEFIKALMPLVFWFFSHQECRIAGSVEPFLTQFFVKVKGFVAGAADESAMPDQPGPNHTVSLEQVRPILMQTLQLIIQRIAYPDWFQHEPGNEDDEQHANFIEFRKSLTKIYRRIFLVDEQLGFQFVQASVAQLTQMLSNVRPMEVEAVLYLYKEAGEVVKDMAKHIEACGPLAGCFAQLCECEALMNSDHWAVQLALIELYVRYGRVFAIHADLFSRYGNRVLEALVGKQGIRSTDPRVVTRACFMLLRFLKVAKKQVAPFTVQIYEAVKDLMVVQYIPSSLMPTQADGTQPKVVVKGALKAEDQACLYEAIASLITALPAEQMRPSLQMLLKVPAEILTEILNAPPAKIGVDVQGFANWASRSVEAIANVSKAFSVQHISMAPDWEAALGVVARILERFGSAALQAGLWRSTLFLCRRMVEVLSDHFLGPLDALLPLLYSSCSNADLNELTIFAHQVVCQYHAKTLPLVQKWLSVLFIRPFDLWKQMPEGSEQLKREKLELACALLQLLKEAAQRCPASVLEHMLRPGQDRLGPDLTAFLLQALADPKEIRALFLSVSAWNGLLELAVGSPASQEAMVSLPLGQLLPQLLWSVVRMDHNDAQAQKAMTEAAGVLRSLIAVRVVPQGVKQQSMEALQQALVAALPGLRTDVGPRRLCELLASEAPAAKDVKAALQQCVSDWRWSGGGA